MKEKGLKGHELEKAKKDWEEEKKNIFEERCKVAAEKHLKMFKIEAFLRTILEKTELVSICSLVDTSQRRK